MGDSAIPTKSRSQRHTINITIHPEGEANYHSIVDLEWRDIPLLAVLTGHNGAGKTQLLELLANKLRKLPDSRKRPLSEMQVKIEGDEFSPAEVAYIPNNWRVTGGGHAGLETVTDQRQQLREIIESPQNPEHVAARSRIEHLLDKPISEYSTQEVIDSLPNNYCHLLDHTNVTKGLADIFFAYRFRKFELYEEGVREENWGERIGPPPWDVLNEVFRASGFPYEVTSPLGDRLESGYKLQLYNAKNGVYIDPSRLSSGEQILLGVVMWLYNAQNFGQFPKLLLLDEPDAHLHPSMTHHFMSVLKDVLVERYGVRVILTTHSPSTVAMSPTSSIFIMSRDQPRISRPPSKAHSLGLLTSGLVTVGETTRYILVEDESDVKFFSAVKDVLSEYGPRKDPFALEPAPSIVFLPASNGTGAGKVSGGSSVVQKWVEKFDAHPLDEIILGIVDHDGYAEERGRIFVSDRYSIENYLYDPINVFGLLLDTKFSDDLPNVGISSGNEHFIGDKNETELQRIVDFFGERLVKIPTFNLDNYSGTRSVEFTNGARLEYPEWMLSYRGHDLANLYRYAFNVPASLTPPRLIHAMRRIRLMPMDLAALLHRIQKWPS